MLYSVAKFRFAFDQDWKRDIFFQQMADIGFETFIDDEAYIQTALLDQATLTSLVSLTDGVQLLSVKECEDANWNRTFENEHPQYEWQLHSSYAPEHTIPLIIIPRCAFGSGTHDTTSMLLQQLQLTDCRLLHGVLDNGCGTGVLAIAAALLGATDITAVDIDEKSVKNTIDNAALNNVPLNAMQASTPPDGCYDLIISNIHRNILLQQMPLYAELLNKSGRLWLSGFLKDDCEVLIQAATEVQLTHLDTQHSHEWYMLTFQRQ